MKSESGPNVRALETYVFLRRGCARRRVTVTLASRVPEGDLGAPDRAILAFLRAVDAELFGAAGAPVAATPVSVERSANLAVHALHAEFPKMRPESFAVLARMLGRSAPDAVKLVVREEAPEAALVVRRFEPEDAMATIADVDFLISLPFSGPPAVVVEFAEDVPEPIAAMTLERLTAWAEVVALGGFPGAGREAYSSARLRERGRLDVRTVGLKLDVLTCSHEGVEMLFHALGRVHEAATITRVAVTRGSCSALQKGPGSRLHDVPAEGDTPPA